MQSRVTLMLCAALACAAPVGVGGDPPTAEAESAVKSEDAGGRGEKIQWPVVIRTGDLYVYGHRLAPPFVFAFENDSLFVNGIRLYPEVGKEARRPGTVTDWANEAHTLNVDIEERSKNLLGEGTVPRDSILARAARLYGASDLVDTVYVRGESIVVYWIDWDLRMRISPLADVSPPALPTGAVVCGNIVRRMQLSVGPATVTFYGNGYWIGLSRQSAEGVLGVLEETDDPEDWRLDLIRGPIARDLLNPVPLDTTWARPRR